LGSAIVDIICPLSDFASDTCRVHLGAIARRQWPLGRKISARIDTWNGIKDDIPLLGVEAAGCF
jgi:hypothetical protein